MSRLTIYRGTHQIGGCCTELFCGGKEDSLLRRLPGSRHRGGERPALADVGEVCPQGN